MFGKTAGYISWSVLEGKAVKEEFSSLCGYRKGEIKRNRLWSLFSSAEKLFWCYWCESCHQGIRGQGFKKTKSQEQVNTCWRRLKPQLAPLPSRGLNSSDMCFFLFFKEKGVYMLHTYIRRQFILVLPYHVCSNAITCWAILPAREQLYKLYF